MSNMMKVLILMKLHLTFFKMDHEEEGEKMTPTAYSSYNQAAAQQGYSAYTAQPTQGCTQIAQAYRQQNYGIYGQPAY